jgi:hypothetical protein
LDAAVVLRGTGVDLQRSIRVVLQNLERGSFVVANFAWNHRNTPKHRRTPKELLGMLAVVRWDVFEYAQRNNP